MKGGIEYEVFRNLVEKPKPVPPEYAEDYTQGTFVLQLSISSDYRGYKLVSNLGFHRNIRSFEDKSESNTIGFVRVYAGAE